MKADAPRSVAVEVEVRYKETDQMGVVHHANYLPWFELARTRLCRETGHPYPSIEAAGYYLIVSGATLSYRQSAHYGDVLRVSCWVERLASRLLRFAYRVERGEELLATGTTDHVWVDRATGKPCRIPDFLLAPFQRLAGILPSERTPVVQKGPL